MLCGRAALLISHRFSTVRLADRSSTRPNGRAGSGTTQPSGRTCRSRRRPGPCAAVPGRAGAGLLGRPDRARRRPRVRPDAVRVAGTARGRAYPGRLAARACIHTARAAGEARRAGAQHPVVAGPRPGGGASGSGDGCRSCGGGLDDRPVPGRLPRAYRRQRAQGHYEQFAVATTRCRSSCSTASGPGRASTGRVRLPGRGHSARVPRPEPLPAASRLHGVLPPGAAARRSKSKARFSEIWPRDIVDHLPETALAAARIVRNGWIELARARAELELTPGSGGRPTWRRADLPALGSGAGGVRAEGAGAGAARRRPR